MNRHKLEKLKGWWEGCVSCALSRSRTNLVHYRGNPNAKMMIIGEAPGREEDDQGVPFVGAAGKALDELLLITRIDPKKDVLITNMVACRPPQNRVPLRDEMKTCWPRLEYVIKIVDPNVILLLGATAGRLAGLTSIGPWRGQPVEVEMSWKTYRAVATYHPSFLIRQGNSPKVRRKILSDIRVARALRGKRDVE